MKLIETAKGPVPASKQYGNGTVTIHVVHTPVTGAGLFVVFPKGQDDAAVQAVRDLVESGQIEPDQNLTDKVPGCLAAGSVAAPKVQFGIPHVSQAEVA